MAAESVFLKFDCHFAVFLHYRLQQTLQVSLYKGNNENFNNANGNNKNDDNISNDKNSNSDDDNYNKDDDNNEDEDMMILTSSMTMTKNGGEHIMKMGFNNEN